MAGGWRQLEPSGGAWWPPVACSLSGVHALCSPGMWSQHPEIASSSFPTEDRRLMRALQTIANWSKQGLLWLSLGFVHSCFADFLATCHCSTCQPAQGGVELIWFHMKNMPSFQEQLFLHPFLTKKMDKNAQTHEQSYSVTQTPFHRQDISWTVYNIQLEQAYMYASYSAE